MDVLLAAAAACLNRRWYGRETPLPAAEPALPVIVRLLAALLLVALLLALLGLAGLP